MPAAGAEAAAALACFGMVPNAELMSFQSESVAHSRGRLLVARRGGSLVSPSALALDVRRTLAPERPVVDQGTNLNSIRQGRCSVQGDLGVSQSCLHHVAPKTLAMGHPKAILSGRNCHGQHTTERMFK